ncbi:hypothetical protein CP557_01535 [Natrinema ejinorense]|uniref:Uncharacterized protein n=2 Tax=Natrinema ejinorense TaxID=373386 RepID=A0A2A5R0F7_9EURY|nr:hypothetical protein CP557_01535 [Natrinema ejinorense]
MAARTSDDSSIEADQAQIDDVVLERRSWNYGYIGEDAQQRHHHVDRKRDRIVVTKAKADRNDSGAVPVFSLEGPILHARRLADHPEADNANDGLKIWLQFVDEEIGWDERPVSAVDQAREVLEEVF